MEGISTKNVIIPLLVVMVAIIIVAVFSVTSIDQVREQCREAQEELTTCEELLTNKTEELNTTESELDTLQEDLTKYDNIYEQTAQEAENLSKELEEEKEKDSISYNIPYRSVPTYDAFSKAIKLELMLERIHKAEEILDAEHVREDALQRALGEQYLVAWEFRELFRKDGVMQPLGEEASEMYRRNNEYYEELQGFYNEFEEIPNNKMETRLKQLVKLQENVIEGMQGTYFLR